MTRVVLLDDGTRLAADIGRYLRSRGYPLEQHGVESFLYAQTPIPAATDILIFCNGEHYGPLVQRFAQPLCEWVRGGGALLATLWAAWSASNLLPLAVRSFGRYREGAQMAWNWSAAGITAPITPFTVSSLFTLQGGKPTRFSRGRNAPLERLDPTTCIHVRFGVDLLYEPNHLHTNSML